MKINNYAGGGRVMRYNPPASPPKGGYPLQYHPAQAGGGGGGGSTKLNMTDLLAALGAMGVAIPAAKMAFGAGKPAPTDLIKDVGGNIGSLDTSQNAVGMATGGVVDPDSIKESPMIEMLRNFTMKHGGLGSTDQKDVDLAMNVDPSTSTVKGYTEGGEVADDEDDDPADVPEEVREFVEMAHQKQAESRPDENWRIKSMDKPEDIAPYKRDPEDVEEAEEAAEDSATPMMAEGGEVPGYDDGGEIPQPMTMDGLPPPAAFLDPESGQQLPPDAPMPKPMVATAPPIVPRETMPAPTEADFMTKANNMLGLNPAEQANFLKMLGDRSNKGQIGAAFAGIGDAIASGGTLGKVNPGNLDRSENIIQGKEKAGIEGMQTLRGNQEKTTELSQQLQAQDPNSPLSKYAQKAYAAVGKKIGIDLSHASASLISDVTGKGVDALTSEYQADLKKEGLALQRDQIKATIANQHAERQEADTTRQADAAKTLAGQGLIRKGLNQLTPSGRAAQTLLQNQATGVKSFNSVQEAESAGLPAGTRVSIGGRMATIK